MQHLDASERARRWLRYLGVAALYFVVTRSMLAYVLVGQAPLLTASAGVAIWAASSAGPRILPAILIASFAAWASSGVPAAAALGIATGSALEAWLGRCLIAWCKRHMPHAEALGFFLAGCLTPLVSASVSLASLLLAGTLGSASMRTALSWVVSGALGVFLLAPLCASLELERRSALRNLSALALLVSSSAVTVLACLSPSEARLWALMVPVLGIATAWLGKLGTRLAAFSFAVTAVAVTASGSGPFAREAVLGRANLHYLLATVSLGAFILPLFGGARRRAAAGETCHVPRVEDDGGGHRRGAALHVNALESAKAALRETEARWQLALDGGGHGVWDWDRTTDTVCYSQQWRAIFGYDADDAITGDWRSRVHPDDLPGLLHALECYRSGELNRYNHEYRLAGKDGRYRWISDRGRAIGKAQDGNTPRMIGTHTDISRHKELEQQLAVARDQALDASRLKSEFLANMSHEIRTPMNGVLGALELLLDSEMTDDQRSIARTIQKSADALLAIINDILDLSKIEAGKVDIRAISLDLHELIEDTVALLAPRAHAKQIRVDLDLELAADRVLGDPLRIRQVLTNFLGNAIKFTDTGGVVVHVRGSPGPDGHVSVRVEVRDTGIGIPKAVQDRLFQPFTQADDDTTRRFGGTGLGLSISRRLVELMAGKVGVHSEVDRGSTFWFELDMPVLPCRRSQRSAALLNSLRALAVDANEARRTSLVNQLLILGVQVDEGLSSVDALERLSRAANAGAGYDLVLLDRDLPELGGIDLARGIRSDSRVADTSIIIVSSGELAGEPSSGLTDACLFRPLRRAAVEVALTRVIERRQRRQVRPVVEPSPVKQQLRLLMAEDNQVNQFVGRRLLEKLGHKVDVVPDGAAALAMLGERQYDAVLMDCQMPEIDGYSAARQIRSGDVPGASPRVPIIALTAYSMPSDRARCMAAGMTYYVSKPLSLSSLADALERCGPYPHLGEPT